ncbi:MAG: imidazole glycerol phosphate synthase subunit HisF [Gammaproteobacteria bacterium]|nr:imidazole glycerol phosphate synthase subunit HisF [Gammaproteobacteria bacterium]
MQAVGIVNTNAGNISSLISCCERMGYAPTMITDPNDTEVDILIIPGQGHFGSVMDYLRSTRLDTYITQHIEAGKTVVGICVGMQILFEGSEESPEQRGLSLLSGKASKLNSPKQPMVGWATLTSDTSLNGEQVYFVNSYGIKQSDATLATTEYGEQFVAAICDRNRPNIIGFQFHPEKSGDTGKRILQQAFTGNFATSSAPQSKASGLLCPRVIACLDVADGRVVKGTKFVDIKDMGDPVELAKRYEEQGADEILYLDITATNEGRKNALETVTKVASQLSIPLTVGGGLNAIEDVEEFLRAGADKVALNTAAVKNPQLINDIAVRFGSQCVVAAIDAQRESDGKRQGQYVVYTHGGKQSTDLEAISWAQRCAELGAGEILITAKHRDGTGEGFDNELMAELSKLPIQVIASGGAANAQHFVDTYLAGSDAALAAGMFHRGEITIGELKTTLLENDITIRKVTPC